MMVTGQLARHVERAAFLFGCGHLSCYYTIMHRAGLIEQLKQTRTRSRNCSRCSRRARLTSSQRIFTNPVANTAAPAERPNKGNKAIEREVIASYQIAQRLGFNGDFRAWEHLLRVAYELIRRISSIPTQTKPVIRKTHFNRKHPKAGESTHRGFSIS